MDQNEISRGIIKYFELNESTMYTNLYDQFKQYL